MKTVFLLQDTGRIYGAERATVDLVSGLHLRGFPVEVVLIEEIRLQQVERPVREAFEATGVPVVSLRTNRRFSRELAAQFRAHCDAVGATIVHSTGYKADLHAWMALHRPGIAHVSTVHGWLNRPDLKERFYAWLNVRALRRCDRVIALTRFYEDLLLRQRISRVERIPTGLDTADVRPRPRGAAPYTFGVLGRLSWEKNHLLFLSACEQVAARGSSARFLIAGEGPLRAEIERGISARGLAGRIEMSGYLSTGDFFGRIDALVLTSRIENLPMVILEAMARACPVIATRVGGVPDVVDDGVTGRLVASDDAGALAAACCLLAESPATGEKWGMAGREKLIREFARERWITRHVSLYENVMQELSR